MSIAAVADQVGGLTLPDPGVLAPDLRKALAGLVDPRKRRGVRHGLVTVVTVAVCAVVARARSFVAIAEWAADLPAELAVALGVDRRCPLESACCRTRTPTAAGRYAKRLKTPLGVYLFGRIWALRCFKWVTQREVMYAGVGLVRVGSGSLAAVR